MTIFQLQKQYFDILTQDGIYMFFYLARMVFSGVRSAQFHFSLSTKDGKEKKSRTFSIGITKAMMQNKDSNFEALGISIIVNKQNANIQVELDDLYLNLDYNQVLFKAHNGLSIQMSRNSSLLWMPRCIQCNVDGITRLAGRKYTINNQLGYIDSLTSTILPPFAPARQVLWARVHGPEIAFTFSHIVGAKANITWSKLYVQHNDQLYIFVDLKLFVMKKEENTDWGGVCPLSYKICGVSGHASVQICIEHQTIASSDRFEKGTGFRSGWLNKIIRMLTRDPWGLKFYSLASIEFNIADESILEEKILCIAEWVIFN